jgi:hypothetical protein
MTRKSRTTMLDRARSVFVNNPGEWIPARALEVAGRQGWRTRVSNLRCSENMNIQNRVRLVNGIRLSEYRYIQPSQPRLWS